MTKRSHSLVADCPHPRPGWRTFDAAGQFCFNLPEDMEVQTTNGVDSYVRVFKGPSMTLMFDFGYPADYRGASPDKQDFRVVQETIDGIPVSISSWEQRRPTSDSLPFKIGLNTRWRGGLGMLVCCASREGCKTARQAFRSIRFQKDPNSGWHKDGWVN